MRQIHPRRLFDYNVLLRLRVQFDSAHRDGNQRNAHDAESNQDFPPVGRRHALP